MPATFTKSALLLSLMLGLGQAHAASQPSPVALAASEGIPHPAVIAHAWTQAAADRAADALTREPVGHLQAAANGGGCRAPVFMQLEAHGAGLDLLQQVVACIIHNTIFCFHFHQQCFMIMYH